MTGRAADLFACDLRSAGRVTAAGSTTHASAKGPPIEVNGNEPDIPIEPAIGDSLKGADPAMDRAAAALRDATAP